MASVITGEQVDGGVYIDVGGRRVWHYRGGEPAGPPTVLVHGVFGLASTWGAQIADLSRAGLSLFVPERSGHGHSPDHPGPFTCEDMYAETVAYLEQEVGARANLVGWSDGGVIALLIAKRRPDLVNRMVVVSTYVNRSGECADNDFFTPIRARKPAAMKFLEDGYSRVSPDGPEHFATVFVKTLEMLDREPDYDLAEFADVAAPTLVVVPDRGIARIEHAIELTETLPHGRLAVLPGTHILPVESPELFNPLVIAFLAADPSSHWLPDQ
ncbi:alpha/beta fold hydrolase [Gordonia rhizosphera]|nr:alpha/beta hydrolase [Gordonia rhizosphera]